MSGYLPSYQLGGPGEASWHRPGDDQRGKRGHVEDFHLITHKHTPATPPPASSAAMLELKQVSVCQEVRGRRERSPPPLGATPCWDNPGEPEHRQ